jgi:hypothetical protein
MNDRHYKRNSDNELRKTGKKKIRRNKNGEEKKIFFQKRIPEIKINETEN